jgi:hypothetical protein
MLEFIWSSSYLVGDLWPMNHAVTAVQDVQGVMITTLAHHTIVAEVADKYAVMALVTKAVGAFYEVLEAALYHAST